MSEAQRDESAAEEYLPGTLTWSARQVETYEASGGTKGTTMGGRPVVVLTMRGAKTGKLRKVPLMRVEHDGRYAAVASLGGAVKNPVWYYNLKADPRVRLQDGRELHSMVAREITGAEKAEWWERCVAAYPSYADYQAKTKREIPVFVLEPVADTDG
jgi:deazaflavin-dependent oxidoreductase (nitroreductase family)